MRRLLLLLRTHSSRFGAASTKKNYLLQCRRFMIGCCLASSATSKAVRSFWFIGVITNASWFLMLAVATKISAGGVALVFVANILPGLILSITAPYWFHLVSYKTRIFMASAAMGFAFFFVGCGGSFRDEITDNGDSVQDPKDSGGQSLGMSLQLFGVSLMSLASCLGEASLLALAGKFDSMILPAIASPDSYQIVCEVQNADDATNLSQENECDNFAHENHPLEYEFDESESGNTVATPIKQGIAQRACITAYSSGTGLGGVVGYGYKAVLTEYFGWGLSATVWSAISFGLAYSLIYLYGLHGLEQSMQQQQSEVCASESITFVSEYGISDNYPKQNRSHGHTLEMTNTNITHQDTTQQLRKDMSISLHNITAFERFKLVLSLWPYTIPLFTVYAAEYIIQAGVWSSIGFPVTSATSRAQFYQYSNWAYQAGVFISRSSGIFWTASILILWLMPFLQVVNLYFFWLNSLHHFWYNYLLMLPCVYAGLLGGSVYVQGFSRINLDMPMELKEFAVASAVIAMNLGILVAGILALFVQSCIFEKNGIEGAVVDCPVYI